MTKDVKELLDSHEQEPANEELQEIISEPDRCVLSGTACRTELLSMGRGAAAYGNTARSLSMLSCRPLFGCAGPLPIQYVYMSRVIDKTTHYPVLNKTGHVFPV